MGRSLTTSLPSHPTVRLVDKLNSTFTGKYAAVREVEIQGKPNRVYEFEVVRGDAPITRKQGDDYVLTQVNIGDRVTIFGTKAINQGMEQAQIGEVITFKFLGKKRGKNGRSFNNFDMTVEE